jgi:hypothetical protein
MVASGSRLVATAGNVDAGRIADETVRQWRALLAPAGLALTGVLG